MGEEDGGAVRQGVGRGKEVSLVWVDVHESQCATVYV